MAFPSNHATVVDLSSTGANTDEAANHNAETDSIFDSPSAMIREPRHLLKKLFHQEPSVVVQPILIQPPPMYPNQVPIYGSGRGYVGGGFSTSYGYGNPLGCC